eukprot:783704-Pyramimonas_sp.AAC.2
MGRECMLVVCAHLLALGAALAAGPAVSLTGGVPQVCLVPPGPAVPAQPSDPTRPSASQPVSHQQRRRTHHRRVYVARLTHCAAETGKLSQEQASAQQENNKKLK